MDTKMGILLFRPVAAIAFRCCGNMLLLNLIMFVVYCNMLFTCLTLGLIMHCCKTSKGIPTAWYCKFRPVALKTTILALTQCQRYFVIFFNREISWDKATYGSRHVHGEDSGCYGDNTNHYCLSSAWSTMVNYSHCRLLLRGSNQSFHDVSYTWDRT